MKIKCTNAGYLTQTETSKFKGQKNDNRPKLVEGEIYEVKEILEEVVDGVTRRHYDVGLRSNLNYIRSIYTGEELDRGETIHWCADVRFEVVEE